MKKIHFLLLIISGSIYSQESKIEIFKSYISDGDKYVFEATKNKIPEKFDQGVSAYQKGKKYAHLKSLGLNYEDEATNLIEKASKAKLNMMAYKAMLVNKPIKTNPVKAPKPPVLKGVETPIDYAATESDYNSLLETYETDLKNYNTFLEEAKSIYSDYALLLIQNNKFAEAKELYAKIQKYDPNDTDVDYKFFALDYKSNPGKYTSFLETETNISQLLLYLRLSLDEKKSGLDQKITQKILKIEDTPKTRDGIATIYVEQTGISHFKDLFLSDVSKINEYREYYIYTKFIPDADETKPESIKIYNKKQLEYYTDLVDLDLEYLKTKPINSDQIKMQTSTHYNNLGWYSLLCQKFENTLDYFNESIKYSKKYDNDNDIANGNIPHAYLFNNKFEEAKSLYLKLKDKPFKTYGAATYDTYKEAFLDDFNSFRQAGISNKNIDEIEVLLQK